LWSLPCHGRHQAGSMPVAGTQEYPQQRGNVR